MIERLSSTEDAIVIVGAGGHARELYGALHHADLPCVGMLDDGHPVLDVMNRIGATHLGKVRDLPKFATRRGFLIGIGSGTVRRSIDTQFDDCLTADPFVHPHASVDLDVRMQPGSVIFAQATVTTNIDIGRHTHVGRGAAIGHDTVLGDYVTVMPLAAISGSVVIAEGATVGTGAVIRQGQTIGRDATVGAGAVVVSDVPPGATFVGNPAKSIEKGSTRTFTPS